MSTTLKLIRSGNTLINNIFTIANRFQVTQHKSCLNYSSKPPSNEDNKESPLKSLLDEAASFEDVKPQNADQEWATLPYAQGTKIRKQGAYSFRPNVDPRETSIILFPGQGNQFVGMAKDLLKFPMARDLFDLANYVLG